MLFLSSLIAGIHGSYFWMAKRTVSLFTLVPGEEPALAPQKYKYEVAEEQEPSMEERLSEFSRGSSLKGAETPAKLKQEPSRMCQAKLVRAGKAPVRRLPLAYDGGPWTLPSNDLSPCPIQDQIRPRVRLNPLGLPGFHLITDMSWISHIWGN